MRTKSLRDIFGMLLDLLRPDGHGIKLVVGKGAAEITGRLHREEYPHNVEILILLGGHDEYVGHTFTSLGFGLFPTQRKVIGPSPNGSAKKLYTYGCA